ncbi:MAG TPA: hypothetical protein VMQ78_01060 [Candidatus Limnocylindria bacterium]|nr:hypothetical protein [Candidatus Limnocylindria bacterium]
MIEDLEGATIEPSRRRHVAALSAATAAVALVLFLALVTPRTPVDAPMLAATPASSPTDGTVVTVTFAATDAQWIRGPDPWISEVRVNVGLPDDVTSTVCATGVGSSPPVHLMVFDRTGQPMAAYASGTTGRSVPLPRAYVGSGWLAVPCDTFDVFAPRINRAR